MSEKKVLQSVDLNVESSPARKRARLDESASAASNQQFWSSSQGEIVLDAVFDHGIGRLDYNGDDYVSIDEDTIFNKNEPVGVDVSCASMTPDSREKQLSILESALTKESLDKLSVGEWDNLLVNKKTNQPNDNINYFDLLSDEVILQIFRWLPKSYLLDIALCCKRFFRLSNDESLWTRMDVANKQLANGELGNILGKQVIVLRLARSEILNTPILPNCKAYASDFRSRLMYLDLSMAHISIDSLIILFSKCRRLKKLSLENVPVNDDVLIALSANKDIEIINFAMSTGMREDGLRYLLTNCRQIRELNIAWTYLNAACVEYICENLPATMDRLNFSGCRKLMSDANVASLISSCPKLCELDLSDCTALTGDSVRIISHLEFLTFVSLSRCYMIPYKSLFYLRRLKNLSYLDVHGGYINANELKEVQINLGSAIQINQFKFSSVARPTVGSRRSSIWNMRVRD